MTRALTILDQPARLLARAAGAAIVRASLAVFAWATVLWRVWPEVGPPPAGKLFVVMFALCVVTETWRLIRPAPDAR